MHASQIHQLCLLSGRINCQGRLYHISQHVIGLTVLLDLHLSHHFWQCLPFVWNFFDVVPVLSLQNFVPLWKQKKIIQRVWKSPKKVSLWNYEPKMKKKFFRIEIVIFSNMYMNFCTKNEKKSMQRICWQFWRFIRFMFFSNTVMLYEINEKWYFHSTSHFSQKTKV